MAVFADPMKFETHAKLDRVPKLGVMRQEQQHSQPARGTAPVLSVSTPGLVKLDKPMLATSLAKTNMNKAAMPLGLQRANMALPALAANNRVPRISAPVVAATGQSGRSEHRPQISAISSRTPKLSAAPVMPMHRQDAMQQRPALGERGEPQRPSQPKFARLSDRTPKLSAARGVGMSDRTPRIATTQGVQLSDRAPRLQNPEGASLRSAAPKLSAGLSDADQIVTAIESMHEQSEAKQALAPKGLTLIKTYDPLRKR